jgi:MFS family permease
MVAPDRRHLLADVGSAAVAAVDSFAEAPGRRRALMLLSFALVLAMTTWFSASAVLPELRAEWGLGDTAAAWLTIAVQLGFVAGALASSVLSLADVHSPRLVFLVGAAGAAGANVLLAWSNGPASALPLRFATGFFLAGVYPPAMKMVATWFRARRGLAIGTVVGALTIGKATPYLVLATVGAAASASTTDSTGTTRVVLAASTAAFAAAVLVLAAYRDGPYPFQTRPFSWGLVADVTRERRWRLATAGYLGHMWELYAFWTWIPAFIAASLTAQTGLSRSPEPTLAASIAFLTIAIGGIGCVWGGLVADRTGRERLVILAMASSGGCALLMPLVFGHSTWILALLASLWGFFVIADSAQFSALVTESVPPHAVGTALTLQTSVGFLLTTVSIQLVPLLVDWLGWRWAFPVLAIGPVLGIVAIRRLIAAKRAMSPVASLAIDIR